LTIRIITAFVAIIATAIYIGLIAVQNVVRASRCQTHLIGAIFASAVVVSLALQTGLAVSTGTATVDIGFFLVLNQI
jgi:hypothetical protein